ncbi:MAG: glycosyltransferase family 2 protein [Saprospiraceae bacterium]|nr:glycosyltransferase family 2 protein [Saprospiraceae bacterium]
MQPNIRDLHATPTGRAMRIAVVLVNWNNTQDTKACLHSLAAARVQCRSATVDIVVVDNHSSTVQRDALKQLEGQEETGNPTIIALIDNAGLATGYNAGIRYAMAHFKSDAIWLLNNDTVVDVHSIEALAVALSACPEVRILGSTIYTMASPPTLYAAGGFRYHAALSIPVPIQSDRELSGADTCVRLSAMDYVSGIAMCVRTECFAEFGMMDESYFLYYEELQLVRQCGGKQFLAWCPASIVYHAGGGSTGSRDPNRGLGSPLAHYYGNRSALYYTRRHHPWWLPVVFIFRFVAKSFLFVRYGEWSGFRPLLQAYRDFLLPGGLRRRYVPDRS